MWNVALKERKKKQGIVPWNNKILTSNMGDVRQAFIKLAGLRDDLAIILKDRHDLLNGIQEYVPPKYQRAVAFIANIPDGNVTAQNIAYYGKKIQELEQQNKIHKLEYLPRESAVAFQKNIFKDWISFTEAVDAAYTAMTPIFFKNQIKKIDIEGIVPIITVKKIKVFKANSATEMAEIGRGTSWCIADIASGMFNTYRLTEGATYYMVEDDNETTPLHKVVINMKSENEVELTDLNNVSGYIEVYGTDWQEYFYYLEYRGVDTSQFKNDELTEREKIRLETVNNAPENKDKRLSWFKKLDFEIKSDLISMGEILSHEELKYLIDHNSDVLIKQYLNVAHEMSEEDLSLLKGNYLSTYLRRRKMLADSAKELYEQGKISFGMLPRELNEDTQYAMQEFRAGRARFGHLPDKMRNDDEFAMREFREGRISHEDLTRNNVTFALQEYRAGRIEFQYLPSSLLNDENFAVNEFISGRGLFDYLPARLKNNIKFITPLYVGGRITEKDLSPKMQAEPDIYRDAYRDGLLEYKRVPLLARKDKDIILIAINNGDIKSTNDVPSNLWGDEDILRALYWNYGTEGLVFWSGFWSVPKVLKEDVEITLDLFNKRKIKFHDLASKLRNDISFAKKAFFDGRAKYDELPKALQDDVEFLKFAYIYGKADFKSGFSYNTYIEIPIILKNDIEFMREMYLKKKIFLFQLNEVLQIEYKD